MSWMPIRDAHDGAFRAAVLLVGLLMLTVLAVVGWMVWPALAVEDRPVAIGLVAGYLLGRWAR